MSLRRDMQELMRQVRSHGYEVQLSKGGHWKVCTPEGHLLVTAPNTPSDHRSVLNTVAELRRAGVPIGRSRYDKEAEPKPTYPQLSESQGRLLANLNAYLHEQGYDESKPRNPARMQFARDMVRIAKKVGLEPPASESAASQALTRFLGKGEPISKRIEQVMQVTLDHVWITKDDAALRLNGQGPISKPDQPEGGEDGFDDLPLDQRLLMAILDPRTTREEALTLSREVRKLLA